MVDTVTLANQERKSQGLWETELSYGGEADLHQHLKKCQKNPGHLKFIPTDNFNPEHLPSYYRDNDVFDFIRAMSDLTVRISIKYVSDARPLMCPGSIKPYPCYSHRGRNLMRVGTGLITFLYMNEGINRLVCRCNECRDSLTPKSKYAAVTIYTAAHVVYDEKEGEHTTCHLFFDKGSTPDVCSGVVTLNRMSDVRGDVARDLSDMVFHTHDLELIERLDKMLQHFRNLQVKVLAKYAGLDFYKKYSVTIPPHVGTELPLVVIVSHPHGCSKQVSVGYCKQKADIDDMFNQMTYTTPTCPGSSGACVFVIGGGGLGIGVDYVHSGGNSELDKELNFSGLGWDFERTQKASDISPEQKVSDFSPDQKTSDISPDQKTSDISPDQKASDISPDQKASDVSPEQKASDISPDQKTSDVSPDQKTSDISPDQKASDISPEQKTSDISPEQKASDISPDQKASDISPDQKASDISPEQKASYFSTDQNASDLSLAQKASN